MKTPEDRRAQALSLIRMRGVLGMHDLGMQSRIHEAVDCADDWYGLLDQVLGLFMAASKRLRTGDAAALLFAATAELAHDHADQAFRPVALGLIEAYGAVYGIAAGPDADFDRQIRADGAAAFSEHFQRIPEDLFARVLLDIISIWLRMLPELSSEVGMAWLEAQSSESR